MNELPSIGSLDRQIVIQSSTPTQDATGQAVDSWSTFSTIWAKVDYLNGEEKEMQNNPVANVLVKFTCRYLSGVTRKMRIAYASEYYNIRFIEIIGRNRFLGIKAEIID